MILNAYAVLSGFVVVLRGIVAVLVLGLACRHLWGHGRDGTSASSRTESENRFYLLSLLASWLLGLSLISWPLLYLLLQSYVPQWPGVMCIYGVTQIGAGSLGASRFLPGLIAAMQCLKPAAVLLSGVWFVLYRIQRQTQTGPLLGRVLLAQLAVGVLALTDAVVEGTYLVIPKQEEFLFTGCCTTEMRDLTGTSTTWMSALSDKLGPTWLSAMFYLAHIGLIAELWVVRRGCRQRDTDFGISWVFVIAVLIVPVTAVYLVEVAAPAVLRLPYHHCLYDLIPRAPDMVVAIVLFVLGGCCVGWASTIRWLADGPETDTLARSELDRLLSAGLSCYLGALVMTFLEVHLA